MCVVSQNDEDDATFWSRLIREEDRPQQQEEPLLPRTARMNAATYNSSDNPPSRSGTPMEVSDAELEAAGAAGGKGRSKKTKGGSKKRHGGVSSEPGPPVEGAVLRVDEWLLDVDESGRPAAKVRLGLKGSAADPAVSAET